MILAIVAVLVAGTLLFFRIALDKTPPSFSAKEQAQAEEAEAALSRALPKKPSVEVSIEPTHSGPQAKVSFEAQFSDIDELNAFLSDVHSAVEKHLPKDWIYTAFHNRAEVGDDPRKSQHFSIDGLDPAALRELYPYAPTFREQFGSKPPTVLDLTNRVIRYTLTGSPDCIGQLRDLQPELTKQHSRDVVFHFTMHECDSGESHPQLYTSPGTFQRNVDSLQRLLDTARQGTPPLNTEHRVTVTPDNTLVIQVPIYGQDKASPDPYKQLWPSGAVLIDHNDVSVSQRGDVTQL